MSILHKFLMMTVLACSVSFGVRAQSRSVGVRFMASEFDLSYQGTVDYSSNFYQVDMGYDMLNKWGIKTTATYNFVLDNPTWTEKGEWAIYFGPGIAAGFVHDYADVFKSFTKPHFMVGLATQVGMEYTPVSFLSVSLDIRPIFGFHFGTDYIYKAGLMGFIPALGLKIRLD